MKKIGYLQMLSISINIRPLSIFNLQIKLTNSCPVPLVLFSIYCLYQNGSV